MILTSWRKHFDSDEFFGDLQLRLYSNLADTTKFSEISDGQLLDVIRDRHVLVLVHGYRNPNQERRRGIRKTRAGAH